MALTVSDRPIRLLGPARNGFVVVGDPGRPEAWYKDSDAPSCHRYLVRWHGDCWMFYAWYQIIDPGDQPGDVMLKLEYFAAVETAKQQLEQAQSRLCRLTY